MKYRSLLFGLGCLSLFIIIVSFSSFSNTGLADDVLDHTNIFRKSRGLPALIMRDDLNDIARRHSADMASRRVSFGHRGFAQREVQARNRIKSLHSFAENVAYGARTAKEVVAMWKSSAGHRRNLLGRFKYIGIGTAKDRRGMIYYTQVFVN